MAFSYQSDLVYGKSRESECDCLRVLKMCRHRQFSYKRPSTSWQTERIRPNWISVARNKGVKKPWQANRHKEVAGNESNCSQRVHTDLFSENCNKRNWSKENRKMQFYEFLPSQFVWRRFGICLLCLPCFPAVFRAHELNMARSKPDISCSSGSLNSSESVGSIYWLRRLGLGHSSDALSKHWSWFVTSFR